jgi:hypothetical protein
MRRGRRRNNSRNRRRNQSYNNSSNHSRSRSRPRVRTVTRAPVVSHYRRWYNDNNSNSESESNKNDPRPNSSHLNLRAILEKLYDIRKEVATKYKSASEEGQKEIEDTFNEVINEYYSTPKAIIPTYKDYKPIKALSSEIEYTIKEISQIMNPPPTEAETIQILKEARAMIKQLKTDLQHYNNSKQSDYEERESTISSMISRIPLDYTEFNERRTALEKEMVEIQDMIYDRS